MSGPYREPSPPPARAEIDVERRHGEYRLVVVSGEPRRGDCSECRHLVGHVTWWCDVPAVLHPRRTGTCGLWEAPDRAEPSWWQRASAAIAGAAAAMAGKPRT